MMTEEFQKGLSFQEHSMDILDDTAEKLFRQQTGILSTYYNRRSGLLAAHLQSRPFTVHRVSLGVSMVIDYIKQIRFMDMKKTSTGKKKRIYEPIYNKPLYGFLFGYAYYRLQLGLLEYLRANTTAKVNSLFIEIPT